MIRITAYLADDGTIFRDEEEAEKHERNIQFLRWYEENKLYDSYNDSYVSVKDLCEWILENKLVVENFLKDNKVMKYEVKL